jgi:hypothetical protein
MLDDTTHAFGLQIGALDSPAADALLGFIDSNFALTKICDKDAFNGTNPVRYWFSENSAG